MEVSEQVIAVLDNLCEKMGVAIDWSAENVLPYVQNLLQRLVTYRTCRMGFSIILDIVILIASFVIVKRSSMKLIKIYQEDGDEVSFVVNIILSLLFLVIGLIFIFATYFDIADLIEILTVPEMYVFSVLKGFMN